MQKVIALPYYLHQHKITRNTAHKFFSKTNCSRITPNDYESIPYGGSSIFSNKPLMVLTGRDPEYSEEDWLNAVTANLILNIGPEPVNTPLHRNWIHRRSALIQTTFDSAAQKRFSYLLIDIKSNWKKFTQ